MIINKQIAEIYTPIVPIGMKLLFVNTAGVWRVKDEDGNIYDLASALGAIYLITVNHGQLTHILSAGLATDKVMYRVTDCPQGVVRVFGISSGSVSASAQLEGAADEAAGVITPGAFGTYDPQANVFTASSGGSGDNPVTITTTTDELTPIRAYTVPENTIVRIYAEVVARCTGGDDGIVNDGGSFIIDQTFVNNGGTVSEVGDGTIQASREDWAVDAVIVGASVRVTVQGAALTNITWKSYRWRTDVI